jgi:hypothetical protein
MYCGLSGDPGRALLLTGASATNSCSPRVRAARRCPAVVLVGRPMRPAGALFRSAEAVASRGKRPDGALGIGPG